MARLVHTQVFYRHGARTPQRAFDPPADWFGTTDADAKLELCPRRFSLALEDASVPFDAVHADGSLTSDAELQWLPGGAWAGDLTVTGMQDAVALGERLRQRYSHLLLLEAAPPPQLEARSTPMRRTIETAMGVLSALAPEHHATIQLNTDDIKRDWMLGEISRRLVALTAGSSALLLATSHAGQPHPAGASERHPPALLLRL
jgi:hypothetical protein